MSSAGGRVRHKDSSARGLRTDGYAITRGRVKPEGTLHGCDRSADLLNSFVGSCVQETLTERTGHARFKREGGGSEEESGGHASGCPYQLQPPRDSPPFKHA